ncbi:MAG: tolB protein precursor protein, partial [Polyangiales bacterium]
MALRMGSARSSVWIIALTIGVLGLVSLSAAAVRADVYVYPRRPSKSNVHYAKFEWKYIDIQVKKGRALQLSYGHGGQAGRLHNGTLKPPSVGTWAWPSTQDAPRQRLAQSVGATPMAPLETHSTSPRGNAGEGGGVRLYFYERERTIARRAAASIEDSYQYLIKAFDYKPTVTFAYFLYASYIEFLQTQLFPLQEGVLGVTSPENLDVTLPYFGDARLFADVSTHELAHEFTIQKIATFTARANLSGEPLASVPLWFVEGLAEFYAKRGIDAETDMLVRDILVNPKAENGYVFGSFWEDRFTSGLWTYKVGQARCAFLEESFGTGTIQRILEATPKLLLYEKDGGFKDFAQLVGKVTGTSPSAIAARFERWIKRRAYNTFMGARQDRANFTTLHTTDGVIQTLRAAPSGELVMYRSIEPDTGRSRLFLFDRRSPSDDVVVAADDAPDLETLHPVAGQNFDLTDHELAFVAQADGADVIYRQSLEEAVEAEPCERDKKKTCDWDIDIDLGKRRGYRVVERGIDAVEAVALSRDGKHLAFVGLNNLGQRDVYLLEPLPDDDYHLHKLTDDIYAERELAFGDDHVVFSSDATGHGKYNLFRVDLRGRERTRLTSEPRDELNPSVLPDGRVMFVAYDERGANLYSADQGKIYRETDVATGLFDVSPGPAESVWALHHYGAERSPVRIARKRLLHEPVTTLADADEAHPPRTLELDSAKRYSALRLKNWELGSIFLMAGVSSRGNIFGQVLAGANDKLRDHGLILSAAMYGDLKLIASSLTYVNEQRRLIWGGGIFNDIRSRIDRTFHASDGLIFASWERYFGGEVLARYPFSRFTFLQGSVAVGGAQYFLLDATRDSLALPDTEMPDRNLLEPWRARNGGLRFQTEANVSIGHNTIGLQRSTGPIRGGSFLLSTNFGTQPFDDMVYQQLRFDGEHYFRIVGPVNLFFRLGLGGTVGSPRAPQYYLSSFHTLRGVPFGDIDYLLGRQFIYATTELQFPIFEFSSFPLIDLEGVLAADAGAVADDYDQGGRRRPLHALWDKRLL